MNDTLNKVTTNPDISETPDTLTDEQMEDVTGGALGNKSRIDQLKRYAEEL